MQQYISNLLCLITTPVEKLEMFYLELHLENAIRKRMRSSEGFRQFAYVYVTDVEVHSRAIGFVELF